MSSSLLLREPPLQVLPSLAVAIGLNEAIALQQVYYLQSNPNNGRQLADGERYVFNTYAEWREYFPFWSEHTVKRVFIELENRHLIEVKQPDGNISRKKYYRVPPGALAHLTFERLAENTPETLTPDGTKLAPSSDESARRTDQIGPTNGPNWPLPLIAKTSSETSTQKRTDEIVYQAYPKKVGKASALKAIAKRLQSVPFERLLEATQAYSAATASWTEYERQFIPHPASWFNGARDEDDRTTWKRKTNDTNRTSNGRQFELAQDYSGITSK